MKANEISVVIPTYNRSTTIKRALDSVFRQSIGKIEIIVVDDASTDNTEEIINELSKTHPELSYYKFSKNKGACAARNKGIELAKTNYVTFLDSDDEWHPNKIEIQGSFLEKNDYDVVICSVLRIEKGKEVIYPSKQYSGDLYHELLRGNFVSTGMIFGKKNCFQNGFDENLPRLQDWDFILNISKKYKVGHLHVPLGKYYIQKDSISMNQTKLKIASNIIYEKYKSEFAKDRIAMTNICQQCAIGEIMTGGNRSLYWIKKAFSGKPSLKTFIIWFFCFLRLQRVLRIYEERKLRRRCSDYEK